MKGLKIQGWFGLWRVRDSLGRLGKPMQVKGLIKTLKRLKLEKK
jgi:hypothetical protein